MSETPRFRQWCNVTHGHGLLADKDGELVRYEALRAAEERAAAALAGQEALKQQTIRIRLAALGDALDPGTDTETIVRELHERIAQLTAPGEHYQLVSRLHAAVGSRPLSEEAATAIEQLQAAARDLRRAIDQAAMVNSLLIKRAEQAETKLAEYKADAERYRQQKATLSRWLKEDAARRKEGT